MVHHFKRRGFGCAESNDPDRWDTAITFRRTLDLPPQCLEVVDGVSPADRLMSDAVVNRVALVEVCRRNLE
jgi:hypothetical protein